MWDSEAKQYLDFFPGWGVSSLGHCNDRVVKAIQGQTQRLIHMPNNFYNQVQPVLARLISEHSFGGKSFFCNSGAEANEAAIKLARSYGAESGRFEILSLYRSFHGRTMATLAATGQEKYHQGIGPVMKGFKYFEVNNTDDLLSKINRSTVAVMMEPLQGEGGINLVENEFMQKVRQICDERDLLLILDEVQTGIGRTGRMFGYQHFSIKPDIMTLAKGLGSGVPVAAMVCKEDIADFLKPGMHATTFGGSPLVCAASVAVMETVAAPGFLEDVRQKGQYILQALNEMSQKYNIIKQVRGRGLMIGIEFHEAGPVIFSTALEKGLVLNCTAGHVIRFMPALNISYDLLDKGIKIFEETVEQTVNRINEGKASGK